MFLERLTQLLSGAFRPKPKYITVTPVGSTGPVAALPPAVLPRHVAIIMDGNGRWAKMRNLPRSAGHAAGTEALREIIRASDDWGIEALSLYAFSTENWARSKDEVAALMDLLLKYFASEIDELDEKNVRITILGDVDGLPGPQRDAVVRAMERTRNNDGLKLNIALNYGGRAELTRAARILAQQVRDGVIDPEDITEEVFAEELYTADSPDVDLLIRTSGEQRTSNFLPWQLTYAEFIFDSAYWPDFTRERYMKCLREYAGRERRFGKETAASAPAGAHGNDGATDAVIQAKPVARKAEPEGDDAENVVLEVTPVIHREEPRPAAEPEGDDAENMVLEVTPVIHREEPRPAAEPEGDCAENVVLEVTPVIHREEPKPAAEPEGDVAENVVLEVTPVIHREEPKPAAVPEASPAEDDEAPVSSPAEEEDLDNFVLEITPVIFHDDPASEPQRAAEVPAPTPQAAETKPAPKAKRRAKAKAGAKTKAAAKSASDAPAPEEPPEAPATQYITLPVGKPVEAPGKKPRKKSSRTKTRPAEAAKPEPQPDAAKE